MNHKPAKTHKTTSVPSSDKNKKNGNPNEKAYREYDEPIKLIDGPGTPNTNNEMVRQKELDYLHMINRNQGSHDNSVIDQNADNLVQAAVQNQGSAQRHLSNKSDTNLS